MQVFRIGVLLIFTLYHASLLTLLHMNKDLSCVTQEQDLISEVLNSGVFELNFSNTTAETTPKFEQIKRLSKPHRYYIEGGTAPWLIFCVTSARRENESYLSGLIQSLDNEISDTVFTRRSEVVVIDVSQDPTRPDVSALMRSHPHFHFRPLARRTRLVDTDANCTVRAMEEDQGDEGRPPCSVRQQTLDVASGLEQCLGGEDGLPRIDPSGWVTVVEDDTEICPGALREMLLLLRFMADVPPLPRIWKLATFSSFFSGVTIPQAIVRNYTAALREQVNVQPVDHVIWSPWAEGDHVEYPGNLFVHKGQISAFKHRNTQDFRSKYDEIRFSFRQTECDIQPLEFIAATVFQRNALGPGGTAPPLFPVDPGPPGVVPPPDDGGGFGSSGGGDDGHPAAAAEVVASGRGVVIMT